MIEKLGEYLCMETEDRIEDCKNKINELVDAVNTIQKEREAERFEIQEWIGILEAVRKSVNIHEKQIDELQMKLEPEKCEIPADNSEKANCQENVQPVAETRSENVQDKLERTRKVLDRAKWWLHEIVENHRYTPISTAEMALKEITALEQKD